MEVNAETRGCRVTAFPEHDLSPVARCRRVVANPDWYWRFRHRAEGERGLDETEDLFIPGHLGLDSNRAKPRHSSSQPKTAEPEEHHRRPSKTPAQAVVVSGNSG